MTNIQEIAQTYLGNINHDADLASTVTATCLKLSLTERDRNKGRIHGYTDSGLAVGIIKSRDRSLQPGDLYQTDSGKLLLISLEAQELLAIDLADITNASPQQLVQLGHALGNHHYPISIEDNQILVQLVTDKVTVEKLITSLKIPGLRISYQKISADHSLAFSQHRH